MRVENIKFVEEVVIPDQLLTVKQQVFNLLKDAGDGLTGTEIQSALPTYSARGIRTEIKSLLDLQHINGDTKCRCHRTSIYKINT